MNSDTPNEEGLSYETNPIERATAPKRAAMYIRSAVSQELGEEYDALATQIRLCRMYCQIQGYTTDGDHIYSQIGSNTDSYNQHPQLTALLEAAKLGAFDVLVISTHNRLSRRLAYATAIIDELQQYGVEVESVDGHDLGDITALAEAIREHVSLVERQMRGKRIKAGKAAKKAEREQQR